MGPLTRHKRIGESLFNLTSVGRFKNVFKSISISSAHEQGKPLHTHTRTFAKSLDMCNGRGDQIISLRSLEICMNYIIAAFE